ncbi:uncharacterized protein LOC112560830 [Pomacea canaliculata]|uniref:uncharacterized protein LOC112560830 n=1 Tax=Pomacea canaliculata TaxID=400727 RepID=UPI000D735851|nr:uncharacterized protein LOC112560830 [Pomacea canaliculata]
MLLWMTVALSWMTVGLACRCLQPTDEGYCKNDIVFRGIAVAEYQEETEEPYPREIRIYTVMSRKSSGQTAVWLELTTFNVTTARSSATCGAYFELNTPYVIVANEENGQVSTNSCAGNTEWKSLDTTQKRFFRRRLRKLCA